jgi:hypothetical protein
MRSIASLVVAGAALYLLFQGVLGPLTPPEGLPTTGDAALYGGLPVILLAAAASLAGRGIVRALLVALLIAAIGVLLYLGISAQGSFSF